MGPAVVPEIVGRTLVLAPLLLLVTVVPPPATLALVPVPDPPDPEPSEPEPSEPLPGATLRAPRATPEVVGEVGPP